MGESRQFTKIERLLEQILALCEPEHVYQGTISEFDTVGSVPKERLVKGMFVDGKEGIRRVYFEVSGPGKSNIKTSLLNLGDSVIIVGKQNPLRETATFPLLVILPERQTILISQQLNDPRKGDPGDIALFVLFCITAVLCVPLVLTTPFPSISQYLIPISLTLWMQIALLCVVLEVPIFGIIWYQMYLRRARTIRFDRDSWTNVVDFIKHRLPEEFSQIFDQSPSAL